MVLSNTDLIVRKLQAKLFNTALDSVPTSESMSDRDVTSETEVFGLEDLVCRWVVQDSLSVNTGLVGESTVTAECTKMISIAPRERWGERLT